jgi:hypothetical protein
MTAHPLTIIGRSGSEKRSGLRRTPAIGKDLVAGRSCVGRESAVVGIPAVDAGRAATEEPGEESQLLQVVGVAVGIR